MDISEKKLKEMKNSIETSAQIARKARDYSFDHVKLAAEGAVDSDDSEVEIHASDEDEDDGEVVVSQERLLRSRK